MKNLSPTTPKGESRNWNHKAKVPEGLSLSKEPSSYFIRREVTKKKKSSPLWRKDFTLEVTGPGHFYIHV